MRRPSFQLLRPVEWSGGDDRAPVAGYTGRAVPIHREPPIYPHGMRRVGVNGEALIDFAIGPDGVPTNLKVLGATAPEFGEAALVCISKWRFRPAYVNGRAVATRMQVPIVFQTR